MVRLSDIRECRTCKEAIYLGHDYNVLSFSMYGTEYKSPPKIWIHVETRAAQCSIKAEPF